MLASGAKISVIVPAFNAETSIGQCVRSLLQQDHSNLEIVVVDDHSSDGTSDVVESLAARDPRIKLLRPEANLGVHGARRLGVSASSGDLIGFVDADDHVERHMYSTMLARMDATGAAIVICSADLVSDGRRLGPRIRIRSDRVIAQDRILDAYCSHRLGSGVLWNKLYRREVIEEPALRELERAVDASEDYIVNFGAFARANSVALCQESLYNYSVHQNNASAAKGWPSFARLFRAYIVCLENYAKDDISFPPLIDKLYLKQLHQNRWWINGHSPDSATSEHLATSLRRLADVSPTSIHSILLSMPLWHSRLAMALGRLRHRWAPGE